MRRSIVLALSLLFAVSVLADAQSRGRRSPRAFITISDGIGVGSSGGLGGGSGLTQMMRVGATARVWGAHGVDIAAIRVQMIVPARGRFADPEFNNPSGDALILSYGNFSPKRGGGFPSVFSVGGGFVSRKRSDGGTLETWAARIGFDSESLVQPTSWLDGSVSAHLLVMPGRDRAQMYTAALSWGFRIG
jgi:hypothetical protein